MKIKTKIIFILSLFLSSEFVLSSDEFLNEAPSIKSLERIIEARNDSQKKVASTSYVYFDYLVDGKLQGGSLEAQLKNPLHTKSRNVGESISNPPYNSTVLQLNGDPKNRIDIVVVGDGYRSNEISEYSSSTNMILDTIFNDELFGEYRNYFNVHRVDVISNESGVDNDPTKGILKDTALDMEFFCSDIERLLCVNFDKALAAANNAPDTDQVLAIANSTKYGGAGYSSLATVSGNNASSVEVAIHEYGHSFGGLADEYEYGGPLEYVGPELGAENVSILNASQMGNQNKKWHKWLGKQGVLAYEGGNYSSFGVFRPTFNSKMRSLGQLWGAVNKEQLIKNIYRVVNPIDSVDPAIDKLVRNTIYRVNPLSPTGRSLVIQWWLDSILVASNIDSYDGRNIPDDDRTHTLALRVVDTTNEVVDERFRQTFMTGEHIWSTSRIPDDCNYYVTPIPPNPSGGASVFCL